MTDLVICLGMLAFIFGALLALLGIDQLGQGVVIAHRAGALVRMLAGSFLLCGALLFIWLFYHSVSVPW